MKKCLLLTCAILSSLIVFAQNPPSSIEVVLKGSLNKGNKGGRSVVVKPTVYVDTDMCQLTISMVASESYTVYVCDSRGTVVYQGSVATDGGRQVYLLPELEADLYSISIEGNSATYEGEFYAN